MVKNKNTGHWYIGKQGNPKKVIGVNYFTTSTSKSDIAKWFQKSFSRDSLELDKWSIRILFQGEDYEEVEELLIDTMGLHHPDNNPLSLNFGNAGESWSRRGTVTVFDNVLGDTDSISQEEYHRRKELNEVIPVLAHPETQTKRQSTCIENHGVAHALQSPKIQTKRQATCIERFGVPNPAQSPEIQAKMQKTCIENLGVDNPSKSEEIKRKKEITCMKNHGVPHSTQSPEVQAKSRETCMKNHGVPYSTQSPAVQAKSRETCMKNLGVEYPSQSPEVQAKYRETCMKIYGVSCSLQSPEIQAKSRETCMKNHGVKHFSELMGTDVIAFIGLEDKIKIVGRFSSIRNGARTINLSGLSPICNSIRTNGMKGAGLFDLQENIFVIKRMGLAKLPSAKYPNLYRVHWITLEEFIEKYPNMDIPEITI
jgi:hypothetical protein